MVLKKNAVKIDYNKCRKELYGNTANQETSKSRVCQSEKHFSPFNTEHSTVTIFFYFQKCYFYTLFVMFLLSL